MYMTTFETLGSNVYYYDASVVRVIVERNGGSSGGAVIRGISKSEQNKYDNNPKYVGSNGSYLDRSSIIYTPVSYIIYLVIRVEWQFGFNEYHKNIKFDVTDYVSNTFGLPKRMTVNYPKKLEKLLKDKKFAVVHDKEIGDWELYEDAYDSCVAVKQ